MLLDRVDGELQRRRVLLQVARGEGRLALLVPRASAPVPEDVLQKAVAVVGAVERLAEAPQVLRRILRLLRDLDHVGVVHLRHLEALLGDQILADVQAAAEDEAGDAEILAAGLDDALGERQQAPAGGGEILGELADVAQRGAIAHRPLVVHLRDVGRVAGLDGGHELLLAIAERRPVELDLDLALLGPVLDLPRQDVVAGRDVALEEPHAQLRPLRVRHRVEDAEPRRRAARDDRRLTQKLATRHEARREPISQIRESPVHEASLRNQSVTPMTWGAPTWPPIPPQRSGRPGKAVTPLDSLRAGRPRQSRDAPRFPTCGAAPAEP